MNKEQLTQELEESREALQDALAGLPDDAYLEPGVVGDWTLKDVLAHLTNWEAQIITLLFRAKSSPNPNTVHFGAESTDELNERWYHQHQDRPLEQVIADFEGIRNQTIRRIGDYSDLDLTDPKRFNWLKAEPLWKWIAEETLFHERDHLVEIRAWRAKREE